LIDSDAFDGFPNMQIMNLEKGKWLCRPLLPYLTRMNVVLMCMRVRNRYCRWGIAS